MATQELGTKRVCTACEAKFYDLNKNPTICPKCDHEEAVTAPKAKRKKPVAEIVVVVPEEKAPEAEKEDVSKEGDTSLDELAAKEEAGNKDSKDDDDEDDLLAIEDDDEEDDFLKEDEEEDDDVSTLVPGGGKGDES